MCTCRSDMDPRPCLSSIRALETLQKDSSSPARVDSSTKGVTRQSGREFASGEVLWLRHDVSHLSRVQVEWQVYERLSGGYAATSTSRARPPSNASRFFTLHFEVPRLLALGSSCFSLLAIFGALQPSE